MCLKDDRGEGLSNPAVGDGQCVEQNKRDRHEEQHDTHKSPHALVLPSPPVPAAPMPPPAPPLPPSRRRPSPVRRSKERSSSRSRITEFHPGLAASPSAGVIWQASDAIARCLHQSEIHWAVVGGACCVLLGSTRTTKDVDIVVSKTVAHNPIEIEVLCYPSTFKITFNSETEILDMNGIRLLHPVTLLNSKCDAVIQRSSMSKREPDTDDITFILLLAIERGMRFDLDEVLSASEDLQNTLEHLREGIKQLFQAVGL